MQEFSNKHALIAAVVSDLQKEFEHVLSSEKEVRVLLSGGSTPGPIYRALSNECTCLDRVLFGLVDERYVSVESEFSNERLLRECFEMAPVKVRIEGMVHDSDDLELNMEQLELAYAPFIERTDLVLLGMGNDGHFASMFPNDSASEEALHASEKKLSYTTAPNHPKDRITCNAAMISAAKTIYLVITGTEKREILMNTALKLPIHQFLEQRLDLHIYYTAL